MANKLTRSLIAGLAMMACGSSAVIAAQVYLPDESQTTTLTATVAEQANITVPSSVTWNVTDVASSTDSTSQTITVTDIVLASDTKQVKLSIQANAASFTPSSAGATTWDAADVSWNGATWTNGTGKAGTLSNTAYTEVVTSTAGAGSFSTTGLVFSLGAKPAVNRAGSHTLVCTWKIESVGV